MTISFPQFFSSLVQPVRQFKHLKIKKFPGCPPCIPFHGPNYLEWQQINTQPTCNNPEFFKILNVNQPFFRIWSTSVLFYISKYLNSLTCSQKKNLSVFTFVDMILVLHCAGLMAWARSSSKLKSLPLGSFTVALNYNKSNSVFQLSVLTERFHYQVTAMVGCNSTCSTLQLIPAFCLIIPRQFSSAHYSVLFPMHSRWENSLAFMKNSPT